MPVINLLQSTVCGLLNKLLYYAGGCIIADRGFNVADCVGSVHECCSIIVMPSFNEGKQLTIVTN